MAPSNFNKNHLVLKIALCVAIIIVVVLSVFLVQQYRHIQRLGYISAHRQSLFRSLHGSGPLTAADASSTESWMTFDYIDRTFVLPQSYLQTTLSITDSRYPRMTIAEYATDEGTTSAAALVDVQNSIRAYFSAKQ